MTDDDFSDLRVEDYSFSEEQLALRETMLAVCRNHSEPTRTLSADEAIGFDAEMWGQLQALDALRVGVPESAGGVGGGLVELSIIARELGRALSAVPFAETVTSARLLATRPSGRSALAELMKDGLIATVGLHGGANGVPQLVPAAGVATLVLTRIEDELLLSRSAGKQVPQNIGDLPVAWWEMKRHETDVVLAENEEARTSHADAVQCWKILTAALLVGMAEATLDLGVSYAKERHAFGVPIGSFQAISHRLVDTAIAAEAAQKLVWRASWFADNEPTSIGALAPTAFFCATRAAQQAAMTTIHVQGGFGFTSESIAQLYFKRSKGLSLLAGDPRRELQTVADLAFGPVRP
jgi:alkylation response protein AidB-like acyl-CoA dehydrogenase